jgi:hypothetical protein
MGTIHRTLRYSNSSDSCQQPKPYRNQPYPTVSDRFRPIRNGWIRLVTVGFGRLRYIGGTVTVRLWLLARIGRITVWLWSRYYNDRLAYTKNSFFILNCSGLRLVSDSLWKILRFIFLMVIMERGWIGNSHMFLAII